MVFSVLGVSNEFYRVVRVAGVYLIMVRYSVNRQPLNVEP